MVSRAFFHLARARRIAWTDGAKLEWDFAVVVYDHWVATPELVPRVPVPKDVLVVTSKNVTLPTVGAVVPLVAVTVAVNVTWAP